MKTCAIYNLWYDSIEHLKTSIGYIAKGTDQIIVVYQYVSNREEILFKYEREKFDRLMKEITFPDMLFVEYKPNLNRPPQWNEIQKREIGLSKAKELSCSHFFFIDSDEYWPDFIEAKQEYLDSRAEGSVAQMWTYFKESYLRLKEPEGYYVPFIHKLKNHTRVIRGKYPYYVDPTRKVNESNITLIETKMHHMSYVRKDIKRKLRNSTAKHDIENNEYLNDYERDLKDGDYIHCFKQYLVDVRT